MCGIFGVIDPLGIEPHLLEKMSEVLRHRGPDDEGFLYASNFEVEPIGGPDTPKAVLDSSLSYTPVHNVAIRITNPRLALGHRRLSIIDLSPAGHQPMDFNNRYWIIFNGEIYNYVELYVELRELGYNFRSCSDTEVILAAYDYWGYECLERFKGMWSFAIFDTHMRTLFLSRDRFGIKPLYYLYSDGRFSFASEIKALVPLLSNGPKANVPRLLDFLIWNITDHDDQTMFEDIFQLKAGHCLTINLGQVLDGTESAFSLNIVPKCWYKLTPKSGIDLNNTDELFETAFRSAISLHLRADVPVGSCLSGGIDSSSIVCVMSNLIKLQSYGTVQKTFTACSELAEFDESNYAKLVAKHAGVEPIFVTPSANELIANLDELIWHQDEPFGSTSIFAQWNVFQSARREGVIVMLDGQGADEALCGYRGYFGAYLAGLLRQFKFKSWFKEALAIHREVGFSWVKIFGYTAAYLQPSFLRFIGAFERRSYADRRWVVPSLHAAFDADPQFKFGARAADIQQMSIAQLTATHLPMLLRWEDRNAMAASVEARVPFLDHHFVELAIGLPPQVKIGMGVSKAILRKVMRGTVPDMILDRKDKIGFATSEEKWLMQDEGDRMQKQFSDSLITLSGILNPTVLLTYFSEIRAGKRPYDNLIWRIIVVGRWINRFSIQLC